MAISTRPFGALVIVLFCLHVTAGEAPRTPSPAQATPAAIPKRDLTGTWGPVGFSGVSPGGIKTSELTESGKQLLAAIRPGDGPRRASSIGEINDPHTTVCDPAGFPRMLLFELRPFQIVQTPNQILMLYTYDQRWRVIWTDGRTVPKEADPRWFGYSTGRWEDDSTLVVESSGMVENTWLDNAGNPHSADMRVTEHYRRVDADNVELTVTITDPKVYQAPFKARDKLKIQRMPADFVPVEMVCVSSEAATYHELMSAPPASK